MFRALAVCLVLGFSSTAAAQEIAARIAGMVVQDGGARTADLVAELCDMAGDRVVGRALVSPSGDFDFDGIAAGLYQVRITGPGGGVLAQRTAWANAAGGRVQIRLAEATPGRSAPGAVTLAELRHHTPSKAVKEFDLASKAFAAGDIPKSIAHLQKAIKIDPEYMEAHNNLGARYTAMRRYEEAAEEFRTATHLDPQASKSFANLAITSYLLKRYDQAEAAARQAVALDHACATAHFVLGKALVAEGRNGEEAVKEFDLAATHIPAAKVAAQEMRAALSPQ